jgi:hypothetical protein
VGFSKSGDDLKFITTVVESEESRLNRAISVPEIDEIVELSERVIVAAVYGVDRFSFTVKVVPERVGAVVSETTTGAANLKVALAPEIRFPFCNTINP